MQRPIKFRAWDKWSNRWIKYEFGAPPVIDFGGYLRKTYANFSYTELGGTWNSDSSSYVLVQYTGLKDKNGVEIYEGDIFHLDDDMAPAVVEYTNEMDEQGSPASEYCLALYEHGKRFQRLSMGEFYINKCEVIGNIYENPELLK